MLSRTNERTNGDASQTKKQVSPSWSEEQMSPLSHHDCFDVPVCASDQETEGHRSDQPPVLALSRSRPARPDRDSLLFLEVVCRVSK